MKRAGNTMCSKNYTPRSLRVVVALSIHFIVSQWSKKKSRMELASSSGIKPNKALQVKFDNSFPALSLRSVVVKFT